MTEKVLSDHEIKSNQIEISQTIHIPTNIASFRNPKVDKGNKQTNFKLFPSAERKSCQLKSKRQQLFFSLKPTQGFFPLNSNVCFLKIRLLSLGKLNDFCSISTLWYKITSTNFGISQKMQVDYSNNVWDGEPTWTFFRTKYFLAFRLKIEKWKIIELNNCHSRSFFLTYLSLGTK